MEVISYIEDILPSITGGTRKFKLHITASGEYEEIKWIEERINTALPFTSFYEIQECYDISTGQGMENYRIERETKGFCLTKKDAEEKVKKMKVGNKKEFIIEERKFLF